MEYAEAGNFKAYFRATQVALGIRLAEEIAGRVTVSTECDSDQDFAARDLLRIRRLCRRSDR
jgi:hypothetical protein